MLPEIAPKNSNRIPDGTGACLIASKKESPSVYPWELSQTLACGSCSRPVTNFVDSAEFHISPHFLGSWLGRNGCGSDDRRRMPNDAKKSGE